MRAEESESGIARPVVLPAPAPTAGLYEPLGYYKPRSEESLAADSSDGSGGDIWVPGPFSLI